MVNYPVSFEAEVETTAETDEFDMETAEGLETKVTKPEEFGGDSSNPSPEDLFNASLTSCIVATFKVTAERKGLEYSEIKASSHTVLDRNQEGRPIMKNAEINVEVTGVVDEELAEEVGQISDKNCFIHNSVKTEVSTEFEFRP